MHSIIYEPDTNYKKAIEMRDLNLANGRTLSYSKPRLAVYGSAIAITQQDKDTSCEDGDFGGVLLSGACG